MINIQITNTKNPEHKALLSTNDFDSVHDAFDSILALIDYNQNVNLINMLKAIDKDFIVSVSDSSVVELISYNFSTELLTVHLTSGTYEYQDTDASTFLWFVGADSKGRFFNKYIRGRK